MFALFEQEVKLKITSSVFLMEIMQRIRFNEIMMLFGDFFVKCMHE